MLLRISGQKDVDSPAYTMNILMCIVQIEMKCQLAIIEYNCGLSCNL